MKMHVIAGWMAWGLALLAGVAQPLRAAEPAGADANADLLTSITQLQSTLKAARNRPIPGLDAQDQAKALGIIDRMLWHAADDLNGLLAPARYPWAYDGIQPPDGLIATAAARLATVQQGKDPWAGRFTEPGGTVIDHALIRKGDENHLIYIRGKAVSHWCQEPSNNFGHAVSKDLKHWTVKSPVLQTPYVGWDEYQVWAPYILEHDGRYWMFYTGVNRNACQAIGLATSDDLENWTRHANNPVVTPGDWGIWNPDQWSDCRDPMVLQVGDTFYCYYTVARRLADGSQSGGGVASSKNLVDWKDEGFIPLPKSTKTPPESIFVVQRGETFYLIYTNYQYGISYATSKDPVRGWIEPEGEAGTILPGVSASEVYQVGDDWYMSYISHDPNALHFLEIQRLIWKDDGGIALEPMKP